MPSDSLPSSYIHGTTPTEQQRLGLMNQILNDRCLAELALCGGERLLDVGSGLGWLSRAMAMEIGPSGKVLGIERSDEQRAEAERLAREAGQGGLVEFRPGDAYELPLAESEWGTFDIAFTRFLLEHVPDPLRVVRQMARAVRPGGRVVLTDDDHAVIRLWPDPPGFLELWHAYTRTYDRLGNDPFIGRRLVALLHEAGVQPTRNNWLFFGGCAGQSVFPTIVDNMSGILRGARDEILSRGLFAPDYFDAIMEHLREWSLRPDAALWFALCWAEGVRPT